jgi:predicted nucleotidyltransferase
MRVVTPTLDGDVLAVLARTEAAFTTGQVNRILLDFSEEGIRRVLVRLARQGIVHSERVGNAYAYSLNRDHLAAAAIIGLAGMQRELIGRIQNEMERWAIAPRYAALFGSAANASMTVDSDIDVFLVRDDVVDTDRWDEQISQIVEHVVRWTGNDTRPLEYTVKELGRKRAAAVLQDVLNEGITLVGSRTWFAKQLRRRPA